MLAGKAKSITKASQILESATTFMDHFQGLLLVQQCNITWQEAREKKIVHFVQALHESQSPMKMPCSILINALIRKWTEEKREQRQSQA